MFGIGVVGLSTLAAPGFMMMETQAWRFHADHVLGTSLEMAVVADSPVAAACAMQAALGEIDRLDHILSGWRCDSELTRLNNANSVIASKELFDVIEACERWRCVTKGAYDARIGQLLKASPEQRSFLAAALRGADVHLIPSERRILRPDAVTFAVDGLAKGYIIDKALGAARCMPGIDGMMIDIGGDLACWGRAPSPVGWRIGVMAQDTKADNALPHSYIRIANQAVATSGQGNRAQSFLSPATGDPLHHIAYATVIADHAAEADALATAFTVLPPSESLALADSLPGVSARILTADGHCATSMRWSELAVPQKTSSGHLMLAANEPAAAAWPSGFSLNINYEVPKIETGSYHNPYVAIWITDENRAIVRTLLIMGEIQRYQEDNYVYWRRHGRMDAKFVESVSKPTRAPGRYTLNWDGRDDSGKKVPQGKYILNIEAARERGGHSVQRIDLTLGAEAATANVPENGELGRTIATYGKNP